MKNTKKAKVGNSTRATLASYCVLA